MSLEGDHTKWADTLTKISFSLRGSIHQTIGYSPHFGLFGQEKICHGSTYGLLRKLDAVAENDLYVQYHPDKISKLHENLMENINKSHTKFERSYNLRSRIRNFLPGQIVFRKLYHLSDSTKKFCYKFAQPYEQCKVKYKAGHNRYMLEDMNGKELRITHTKDIKE